MSMLCVMLLIPIGMIIKLDFASKYPLVALLKSREPISCPEPINIGTKQKLMNKVKHIAVFISFESSSLLFVAIFVDISGIRAVAYEPTNVFGKARSGIVIPVIIP